MYQEGLPDYWGIETLWPHTALQAFAEDQEGLPDYWGIETMLVRRGSSGLYSSANQEGLPDYWGIETLRWKEYPLGYTTYQEGLPDYWGIETNQSTRQPMSHTLFIRKDYPTTGVLKQMVSPEVAA